jgi:hypothetical protein
MASTISSVEKIQQWISTLDVYLKAPEDSTQLVNWLTSAEELSEDMLDTSEEIESAFEIIETFKYKFEQEIHKKHHTPSLIPLRSDILEHMNTLCNRPQTEQRTSEWYLQIQRILGASEFYKLFGTPSARAKFILEKANPEPRKSQPLVIASQYMSPFDWGIRFEPVVKQIYEHKYSATIKELGRLISDVNERLSASPDGLVYSGPRMGRLLEIKCPVTREPDGIIPKQYYTQMQSQMFVSKIDTCDYVEAVFVSKYSSQLDRHGPGEYTGEILIVQTKYDDKEPVLSYVYSPINLSEEFNPELKENEEIVERIPWYLHGWHEQVVRADPHWWDRVKPAFDLFWEDVEKAKRGEFVVPESKPRNKKQAPCMIVIREGYEESPKEITTEVAIQTPLETPSEDL